jgi:hypothetical protein
MALRRMSTLPAFGRVQFSEGEQPRRTWPIETAAMAVPIEYDTSEADEFGLDHPDARERGRATARLIGMPQIGGCL